MCFVDVVARWPGATHDSFVLRNSNIFDRFDRGEFGDSVLLGDSGYPLKSWLMTPMSNPQNDNEIKYNRSHKKTRVLVERYNYIYKIALALI